jgi:hypothetical protein
VTDLHFLPSLRRGLARHAAAPDPGAGGLAAATVPMAFDVAGTPVSRDAGLLGPHRVASLAPEEIVRRYPVPGAVDVETNCFPHVEFFAPDLPWRFTPAAAGTDGRLRPWLALVVVDTATEDIVYASGRLSVAATELHQLPPAAELWGWAHVQSSVAVEEVAAAVEDDPAALLSRIVCPRRLEPGRTYRAAVVTAFAAGADEGSEPAWTDGSGKGVELLVHDTWTFTTADAAGDFESLCELLAPATEAGRLGVRTVDVTAPGLPVGWPRAPMTVDLVGALADPAVVGGGRPAGTPQFAEAIVPVLDDALGRAADAAAGPDYDALQDDPVAGLPFHGSWPAHATSVPAGGWARELNVWTTRRMAAGLGARTVRHNQEALMAAAWDQLGAIREAADELNRARLGAEVARSRQVNLAAVAPGDRIALAAPLLTFVSVGGTAAREAIAEGRAPTGLMERAWLRRSPRARGASAATAYVEATRATATGKERAALKFQRSEPSEGLNPLDAALTVEDESVGLLDAEAIRYAEQTGLARDIGGGALLDFVAARRVRPSGAATRAARTAGRATGPGPIPDDGIEDLPFPPPTTQTGDVTAADVADAVASLDPIAAARVSVVARVPAFAELLPAGELPSSMALAPEFADPLFWDLAELDEDVIVPGLDDFPPDRVRLLAVDPGFVGAYLGGANHEMAREFLWREYPADLSATFFARFFDYGPGSATKDILPMADWTGAIADNLPGATASTAILIRGELVRRYPDVNVFLAPDAAGKPAYDKAVQPSFEGRLGSDVLVVGFPLPPSEVLGEEGAVEHWIVFEERVTAPRFGLDVSRDGPLTTWSELAWTDFEGSGAHIGTGPIPGLGARTIGGVEWGRNAAHLAAAVHQAPYRRAFPATELVVP